MITRENGRPCPKIDPALTQGEVVTQGAPGHPGAAKVQHDGRWFPLILDASGWRLRSRARGENLSFRTGTANLKAAKARAVEWLASQTKAGRVVNRRGGGTLAALVQIYDASPKRTKKSVGYDNASRLRALVRKTLNKSLDQAQCSQIGPEFWQQAQVVALAEKGLKFDLTTRRRENIAINSAIRAARALFVPAMLRLYRAAGLVVRDDASEAVALPVPYLPPSEVDDAVLVDAWRALGAENRPLWLTIGLGRFAGLRREEISACKREWIVERSGAVFVELRDRPDEGWWTKTGKPYRAQIIDPDLAAHLLAMPEGLIVPNPSRDMTRPNWFERIPQKWLRSVGIDAIKPLHRLRGLYADALAALTEDAVAARLEGIKAASKALGHTTITTTQNHYLKPE